MTEEHIGRRIARAMITIFVFQLFWKFGGLIVSTLVYRQFARAGEEYKFDAFSFAEGAVIWVLYSFFDQFIFPVFLPLFSDERELRGEDAAWRFATPFVNVLILALGFSVAACTLWAHEVVNLVAREWIKAHASTADLAIRFTRWMMPGLFFVALGSFTHALLNAYKRFSYAAAGAAMHRFAQVVLFLIAFKVAGAPAIWAALAFTLAAPVKLLTHALGLKDKLRLYRPVLSHGAPVPKPVLRWLFEFLAVLLVVLLVVPLLASGWLVEGPIGLVHLGLITALVFFAVRGLISWLAVRRLAEKTLLQRMYLLAYPTVMGIIVARARDVIQASYAARFDESGLFGAVYFAKKIGDAPLAIIPLALSMAMFPFLCDMFTKQNLRALAEVVGSALKMIVLFLLPLTVMVVILRVPIIELLGSRKVKPELVDATALALALYSLAFIFYASEMALMQTYFSLQNTWIPAVVGAVSSLAQVGFLYVAFDVIEGPPSAARSWLAAHNITQFIVVALAYPLSRALKNLILVWLLQMRLKLFRLRDAVVFVPQVALVAAATGLATWRAWLVVAELDGAGLVKLVRLAAPSAVGVAAFFGALFVLRWAGWPVREFELVLRWFRETGWQRMKAMLRGRK